MAQPSDSPDRPTVVVAAGIFPGPDRIVEQYRNACTIAFADLSTAAAIATGTAGADAVVVATQRLDPDRLHALASTVRVIGRAGVGLDSIDLDTAERLGIGVISQPTYGAVEVASHAVGLMIAGIGVLGIVTATLASWLVERVQVEERESDAVTVAHIEVLAGQVEALTAQIARLTGERPIRVGLLTSRTTAFPPAGTTTRARPSRSTTSDRAAAGTSASASVKSQPIGPTVNGRGGDSWEK